MIIKLMRHMNAIIWISKHNLITISSSSSYSAVVRRLSLAAWPGLPVLFMPVHLFIFRSCDICLHPTPVLRSMFRWIISWGIAYLFPLLIWPRNIIHRSFMKLSNCLSVFALLKTSSFPTLYVHGMRNILPTIIRKLKMRICRPTYRNVKTSRTGEKAIKTLADTLW